MPHSLHASPAAVAPGIADYIIVVSTEDDFHANYHHFAEKVNRKLRAGYQLHGPPFNIDHTLCQTMVRSGDVPPSGSTTMFIKRPDHTG
jgi:hypothetical protein